MFKSIRNFLLLIILILVFYLITYSITKYTGFIVSDSNEKFMDCLKEKYIDLYVYENINEVKSIKDMNIEYFDIHKCKFEELNCSKNNVSKYPSWIVEDNIIDRDINIFELSDISGCEIN